MRVPSTQAAMRGRLAGNPRLQLQGDERSPHWGIYHTGTAMRADLPGNLSFSFREMRAAVPAPRECPVTTSPYPLASRALSILAPTPWPVSSSLHGTGRV